MKKTIAPVIVLACLYWSCAGPQTISPTLYVENLPQTIIAELSLDERVLTEEAWSDLKDGEGERAKKKFMKLGTESPLYYAGLGYALYLLDDTNSAEDFFRASLQFYPDLVLIHVGLAQIYEDTGREDSAFSEYRSILKIEPEHSWAKPRYESIKNSKTEEALREGRQLYNAEQLERSKSSYLKALFYSPSSTEAHFALARIYGETGRYKKARELDIQHLDILLDVVGPSRMSVATVQYNIACMSALLGEHRRALTELDRAVELGYSGSHIFDDPDLDSLRGDPRFQSVIEEIRKRREVAR